MEDCIFDSLELLYIRRLIMVRLDILRRTLEKNRRYFRDTDDDILWQQKVGSLEVEVECLENAKKRINMQIAYNEFYPSSNEDG